MFTYTRAVDVGHGLARGKGGGELGGDGNGDDVGAVDEVVTSLAESRELGHGGLEVVHHSLVVGYWAVESECQRHGSRTGAVDHTYWPGLATRRQRESHGR